MFHPTVLPRTLKVYTPDGYPIISVYVMDVTCAFLHAYF